MNKRKYHGITLTELMVTVLITSITITVIGIVMLDSYRGWLDSYSKVYGGAANDASMAQAAFEKIVRKASASKYLLNGMDDLTVFYYDDWQNSSYLDRYARFYRSGSRPEEFYVEHGRLDEDANVSPLSTVLLCSTLVDADFKPIPGGIEMRLMLNDGRETTTALTTAILHNE